MKLVIDIPEELLNKCIFGGAPIMSPVDKARCIIKIGHGKRLPEGHGDLIDRKALMNRPYETGGFVEWYDEIKYAPTIIEADKEGEI